MALFGLSMNGGFVCAKEPSPSFQRTLSRAIGKNRLTIVICECIFIVDTEFL